LMVIVVETSAALEAFSGPGLEAALGRAAAYTASGNTEKALAECEAALRIDPKNRTAINNRRWLLGEK